MAEIGTHWRVLRSISMVISLSFLLASMFVAAERRSFRLQTSTYYYTPSQESGADYYISHLSHFLWQSNQSSYQHVWPGMKFGWKIVLGTIIGFFGAAFGSVGGVGGGGIFVPMLNLIIGFDAKSATAISKCMIMGGAASTVYYNIKLRHPTLDMPIIDYDLALLVQPMLMLGVSIGVAFNVIFAYWMVTILLIILFIGTSTKAFLKGVETWKKETIMKKDTGKRLEENGNVREETEYKLLGGLSNDNQNDIKDVEPEDGAKRLEENGPDTIETPTSRVSPPVSTPTPQVASSAPVPTLAPAKKQVCIPSILQPISILTETQQRRDQAGVIADLEFMPPENAQALEQVIQATGVRMDAQISRLMKERASKEAAIEPSKSPPSPKDKSVSSSSSDNSREEMTMEDIASTMMVMPTVIVVSIPQATDTIEAAPTEGVDIVKDKQGVSVEASASIETTVEEIVKPQKVQKTTSVTKPEATPPASIQETVDIPLAEQSTMADPSTAFEAAIPEIVEEMPTEPPLATTVFPPIVETTTQKEIEKEKDTAADIPELSPIPPVARTLKFEVSIIENVCWKELVLLVFVWVAFLALQIVKNNTATCSIAYWVLNSLQIPVSVGVSLYEAIGLYKGKRVIASRGDTGNDLKVHQLFVYCFFGILAGVVGGLLGLGGGFILGPLFLELGVPPEVSSATATFVMVFSSSMSVVEYYLLKRFPVPYALYFIAVATIAAFVGQHVVRKLINILGRASLIIFILAFTIFVSAIALGGVGISNMIRKFQHHAYMGFENLCTYNA